MQVQSNNHTEHDALQKEKTQQDVMSPLHPMPVYLHDSAEVCVPLERQEQASCSRVSALSDPSVSAGPSAASLSAVAPVRPPPVSAAPPQPPTTSKSPLLPGGPAPPPGSPARSACPVSARRPGRAGAVVWPRRIARLLARTAPPQAAPVAASTRHHRPCRYRDVSQSTHTLREGYTGLTKHDEGQKTPPWAVSVWKGRRPARGQVVSAGMETPRLHSAPSSVGCQELQRHARHWTAQLLTG